MNELSIENLVRRTFTVWWRNKVVFLLVTLATYLPLLAWLVGVVFVAAMQRGASLGGSPFRGLATLLPLVALGVPLMAWNFATITHGALESLAGRPVGFGELASAGFRRLMPMLATALAAHLAILAGLVLLVVPGLVIGCGFVVVVPVAIAERAGVVESLKRSFALTRGSRLLLLGAGIVLALAITGINLVVNTLLAILGSLGAVFALPYAVVALTLASLWVVFPAVAYHALRAAKEGAGAVELAKVFE